MLEIFYSILPIFLILFSVDCELSKWSEWSGCPECGKATKQTRSRKIQKESKFGGRICDTTRIQTKDCNNPRCPNVLPSFVVVGQSIYNTPIIEVTFPKYFLER